MSDARENEHCAFFFEAAIMTDFAGAPFFMGRPFRDVDRELIRVACDMVPTLSTLLGSQCEVLVHSFEDPAHAVVAAAGTELSGRTLGDPIQRHGLETLIEKIEHRESYFCLGPRGVQLKTAVSPIMSREGRCLGSLSLALNLDAPFSSFLRVFSPSDRNEREQGRVYGAGLMILERIIAETCARCDSGSGVTSRGRARAVIRELEANGIFSHRGATELVSRYAGISKATVYWHLREIRNSGSSPVKPSGRKERKMF